MKTKDYLLLCALGVSLLSCGDDPGSEALPAGKYPLTFSPSFGATVDTRADAGEWEWADEDKITVRVEEEGAAKEYKFANGTFISDDPFYWTIANEKKTVSAWYPVSVTEDPGNGISFTVGSDQSGENYKLSDFLYAPKTEMTFNDNGNPLPFYHQLAKVVINIKQGDVLTPIGNVMLGGADNGLALQGSFTVPAVPGEKIGTWAAASGSEGTITPKEIEVSATPGNDILKTYVALVIPQAIADKKFIGVTISGDPDVTYYYTPASSTKDLQPGKVHTYNVTVKADKIEVETVVNEGSGSWGYGGDENITSSKP